MHHVLYSIFLAVTTILLLWQLFDQNISAKIKAFEFFFLTSTTINLFLNGGRTGQLAFLLAIFVFTVTYFGFQKKYLLRTFIGVTILLTLAYQFSPIFHARVHQGLSDIKGIAKGNLNNSWGLRIAMKKVVLEIIKDHPLLGVGVGDVLNEFRHYQKNSDMKQYRFLSTTTHVHDQFLQIVLQTGLIGLVFFILFLYHLFKTDYGDPFTKAIAYSILTIFIFSFFTDVPLRSFTAGLFGFIVGYLLKRGEWATNIKETS
jgi:O-antigen ligase